VNEREIRMSSIGDLARVARILALAVEKGRELTVTVRDSKEQPTRLRI
jgi:hypothetical protein